MADYEKPIIHGVDDSGNKVPVKVSSTGVMQTSGGGGGGSTDFGTPITGEDLEDGGSGNLGWLSSIRKAITSGLKLLDADGVIQATIKAASTQASITDTALVTASRDRIPTEIPLASVNSLNAKLVNDIDVTGYKYFAIQVDTTSFTGTFTFNQSLNNVNYNGLYVNQKNNILGSSGLINSATFGGVTNSTIYATPIDFRYLRVQISAYTSGSISGTLLLFKEPIDLLLKPGLVYNFPATQNVAVTSTTVKSQTYPTGTINTSGDNTIIAAPGGGLRLYITAITIQLEAATATTILFKSGATTFKRILCQNQGDGISLQYAPGFELRLGLNEAFILNLSGANAVGYSVEYYIG